MLVPSVPALVHGSTHGAGAVGVGVCGDTIGCGVLFAPVVGFCTGVIGASGGVTVAGGVIVGVWFPFAHGTFIFAVLIGFGGCTGSGLLCLLFASYPAPHSQGAVQSPVYCACFQGILFAVVFTDTLVLTGAGV